MCTQVSSLYRYETNGASTAEVEDGVASTARPHDDREDGVASTARPHDDRECVARDVIHD